jgi:hypothetical protein
MNAEFKNWNAYSLKQTVSFSGNLSRQREISRFFLRDFREFFNRFCETSAF